MIRAEHLILLAISEVQGAARWHTRTAAHASATRPATTLALASR